MKDQVLKLLREGKTSEEIALEFKVSKRKLFEILKQEGETFLSLEKLVKNEKILTYYNQGLTNVEIEQASNISRKYISSFLKSQNLEYNTKNAKPNDTKLIDNIKNLVGAGYTNLEISETLHISPTTARKYTKQLGLDTNSIKRKPIKDKDLILSDEQLEVIYGSLLGDLYIESNPNGLGRLCIHHGGNQEDYFDNKCNIFTDVLGAVNKSPRYDNRFKKYLPCFQAKSLYHKVFNDIKSIIYPNGNKTISNEWLEKVTPRGIAYWFMDDGSYKGQISTLDFSLEEQEMLQAWLLDKFKIKVSIEKQRGYNKESDKKLIKGTKDYYYYLYLLKETRKDFDNLIYPYTHPSMLYKLQIE